MVQGQRLQQWELKAKEALYTLNDESGSTSSGEPIFKKVKPVSVLMSNETKQVSHRNGSKFIKRKKLQQSNKMQLAEHKMDADSVYNLKHKTSYAVDLKNRRVSEEPASLGSNLIFMQSILKEIKVARENMFIRLRNEMRDIMGDDIPKQFTEEGCSRWRSVGDYSAEGSNCESSKLHARSLVAHE